MEATDEKNLIRDFATVSDEAFALLVLENIWDKWIKMDALAKIARLSGQNLETCQIKEIQLVMDCSTHTKIMGCVLGHVGTS